MSLTPAQEDLVATRVAELIRLVTSTDIVGTIPEPLISPLLRAQALAMWIEKQAFDARLRATSASGVPLTRRRP